MKIKFKRKKNMGFTLIELIAVVAVIAIIMIILIPNISSSIEKKTAAKKIEIESVITAASETYITSYRSEIITGGECYIYVNDLIDSDYVSSKDISGYEDAYVIFKKGTEDGYAIKDLKYVTDYNVPECKSNINPLGMSFYKYMKKKAVMDNKSSTYVNTSSGIDFTQNSSNTNGKGIYERAGTENNVYPIYYFRGEVNDNNVIFADFCFKIIRTTETGGIKMIYNGVASSDGKCNNTGNATEIGKSEFNVNYKTPVYSGYMYGIEYPYSYNSVNKDYTFANDVTYNSSTNKYTLTGDKRVFGEDWEWNKDNDSILNTHYVCYSDPTCSSVDYVYDQSGIWIYYITLDDGKKIEDVITDMFDNNSNNSTIKSYIDNWYSNNIESKNFSTYIEDTVFCNDRSIVNYGYFDSNNKNPSSYLMFGATGGSGEVVNPDYDINLSCSRNIDKFSVSSSLGNGSLDYPVGLITLDEVSLVGGRNSWNQTYYLYSGSEFWTMTPRFFGGCYVNYYTMLYTVSENGYLSDSKIHNTYGVRPVISLKEGTVFNYGDGTADNPYKL